MTTQTHVLPDLDEALDFEPTCQRDPCDQVAEWLGWTDRIGDRVRCTTGDAFLAAGNEGLVVNTVPARAGRPAQVLPREGA